MAETSLAMLSRIAPQFDTIDSAERSIWISEAAAELSVSWWGAAYARACILLTAHNLTLRARAEGGSGQSGGAVNSEKVGQVGVTYGATGAATATEPEWHMTTYGMQLRQLSRRRASGFLLVDSSEAV